MRFLYRLRGTPNLVEVHELAVKLGLLFGPYFLHRQHPLPEHAPSLFEVGAMILHLLGVPAAADAEDESAAGEHVETGYLFCRNDRVTFDNETDAGGHAKFLRRHRGRGQSYKQIVRVPIFLREIAAARVRAAAVCRNMCVLRQPQ